MRAAELEAGRLSVKALKAELTLLSVPHADAVEKSDLVDRLIQARQLQSPGCDGKSAATFASADTVDDKLSLQELDDALRSAGVEWSPRRVRCLLGLLDVDGDGRVEKEEFKKTLEQIATAITAVARAPISIGAPKVQPDQTADPPTQPAALPSATDLGVDEERLAEWRRLGGGDLEPVLASGAVALLDAQWIINHAEAGGVLTHRQALPEEAFLSLADLVEATGHDGWCLPVAALSYPWLTKDHPDPRGANLSRVARALKALTFHGENYEERLGVFWDFGSLHQHPDPPNGVLRTEEQNALFKQGLGCLGTLYSHPYTFVLRLTSFPDGHKAEDQAEGTNVAKYFDRGWCATENAWASLSKGGLLSLDLGKMRDGKEYVYGSLIRDCTQSGGRRPPLLPSAFAAELETKSFTNGKDDKPLVKRLYEAAFEEQFGKATELNYYGLGWGVAEAAQLAEVLASGAAPRLETLWLRDNKIGDEGCTALAAALGKEGAAPRLKVLNLFGNKIGDEGWKALAAALKEGAAPSLKELVVDSMHPELVAVCKERSIGLDL